MLFDMSAHSFVGLIVPICELHQLYEHVKVLMRKFTCTRLTTDKQGGWIQGFYENNLKGSYKRT